MTEKSKTGLSASSGSYPTASLLARASEGDQGAQDQLVERYWKALRSWAHGRLPLTARERADTEDLVQITMIKTLRKLGTVQATRKGDFTAYLHRVLMNQIRDEIRRAARRPRRVGAERDLAAKIPSPFRLAADREFTARYRRAIDALPEKCRTAIIMRLELAHSYKEIARAIQSPSANAARMLVQRSIAQLGSLLEEDDK